MSAYDVLSVLWFFAVLFGMGLLVCLMAACLFIIIAAIEDWGQPTRRNFW